MIDYLTNSTFVGYNEYLPPSGQTPGIGAGGVSTKTARVLEALSTSYRQVQVVETGARLSNQVVLVEPLLFSMRQPGAAQHEIDLLKNHEALKILYCSEKALLRLDHELRQALIDACDVVTCNCTFQNRLFKYLDINAPVKTLCDPVPDKVFTYDENTEKQKQIVATGHIDWFKNPQEVAQVFEGLEGAGIERVYIGSSRLWSDAQVSKWATEAEQAIHTHADTVLPEANRAEVARTLRDSRFGLWTPFHETFGCALNEMLMSGVIVVGSNHGAAAELPITRLSGAEAKVAWVKKLAGASDSELKAIALEVREWAKTHCSYEVFLDQFKALIC